MSRKDSRCDIGRKAQVETKHRGAAGLAGREQQALMLRLMTKLWRRFEATAERELGAELMLHNEATSQSSIGCTGPPGRTAHPHPTS
jgi:hypothetical protein